MKGHVTSGISPGIASITLNQGRLLYGDDTRVPVPPIKAIMIESDFLFF
jgi:hypothetical protein